ncbi:MAG TPA: hypothetical protein PLJ34_01900, partial [Hyphomicrobiales bacterium]|nr:hypothetical protein [Hyphomicrobiales bacterium]
VPLAVAANGLVAFDRHLAKATEACRLAANNGRGADFAGLEDAEEFYTLMAAVERLARRAAQPADSFRPVVDEAIRVCHAAAAGELDHRIVGVKSGRAVCNDLARAVNRQLDVADVFARELEAVMAALAAGRAGRRFAAGGLAGRHAELAAAINRVVDRVAAERAAGERRTGDNDPVVGAMLRDLHRAAAALGTAMHALPASVRADAAARTPARQPHAVGRWSEIAEITRVLADRAELVAGGLDREPAALGEGQRPRDRRAA